VLCNLLCPPLALPAKGMALARQAGICGVVASFTPV